MYKHFTTLGTKRISSHRVFLMPKQIIVQRSMRLCSFCNFYHWKTSKSVVHHQIRTSTTTMNLLGHSPVRKKDKQRNKKYAELLEVTNKATSNKRATLQKAKASDISMFLDRLDNTTGKSHNIKNPSLKNIAHSENIDKESIDDIRSDIENNIHFSSLMEMEYCNQFPHNKVVHNDLAECHDIDDIAPQFSKEMNVVIDKETDEKLEKIKMNTKPKAKKEQKCVTEKYATQYYIESLLVHMQVYLNCGLLNRAKRTLMKYRKIMENRVKPCNKCIDLYNILLEAYAFRRDVNKVMQLYLLIKEDCVAPTPQTYVYIFDALGRESIPKIQIKLLEQIQLDMYNANISVNDIFNKSHFKHDQEENVLRIVKMIKPGFERTYTTLNTEHKCPLLRKIPMGNNYQSPVEGLLTIDALKDFLKMQLQNESAIEVEIESIEKRDRNSETVSKSRSKVIELENYWKGTALAAFERNLKCLKEKECHSNALMVLHPFLEVLDKKYYVNAILREIKQLTRGSETYSTSLKLLCADLGKHIYKRYEIKMKQQYGILDSIVNIYQKYLEWYLNPKSMPQFNGMDNRTVWQHFELEEKISICGTSLNSMCLSWPTDVITNVGRFLYNIILNDIILKPDILKGHDFKCSIPAFYTLYRNKGHYLTEQIKPHPFVSKLYKDSQLDTITFDSFLVPSHGPPRPWTSIYTGGYLITKTDFVRTPYYSDCSLRKVQDTPSQQLLPVFDSLNQLSSIPWTINSAILDIVIEIFQEGGSVELNVPRSNSVLSPPPSVGRDAMAEEKRNAIIAWAKYKQKKYEMYSLWCDALYRLSLANHFRNKIFWLPHNLDFRGRVYPVPPHLNHLSSDLGRSLLLFAKGKPLGPKGLDWLKLHVINLTNLKKGFSLKERLECANQNMENILDSAANPLTGKMWWKKSEEPWQTLAGCIEIANALKAPNVETYESKYPIHQDGSCNGLQHYAALGRDQSGAESVNLYPFDTPKDVYTAVAAIVEEQRQTDAANNIKIAQILEGHIKRKVIKQTVMTTVYGVTKYGAKLQIAKQLKDVPDFPEESVWGASLYLADKTFYSLRAMFKSAREIQDWFTACARIISGICGENVEWVTPLGLPIVQPYSKQKTTQRYTKYIEKPDSLKQKNAFAPNFIHSLDSTHMMLTSLHCREEGITFVSVHDCFWTHACTVDIMNKICREQFVALHSQPILEDLATFFTNRYLPIYRNIEVNHKKYMKDVHQHLTSVPSKGTFDINKVLSSTYFFS